jgi:hypothetical protein
MKLVIVVHEITVTAKRSFGEVPELKFAIDLADFRGQKAQPEGSLHEVAKAIEHLAPSGQEELAFALVDRTSGNQNRLARVRALTGGWARVGRSPPVGTL